MRKQKSPVSAGINDPAVVYSRTIATGRSCGRNFVVLIVLKRVLSDGMHNAQPVRIAVELIDLAERFIHVRHGGDHWRAFFESAAPRFPIEWVAPRVMEGTLGTS